MGWAGSADPAGLPGLNVQQRAFAGTQPLNDSDCFYFGVPQSCNSLDPAFFFSEWIQLRFVTPVVPTWLHTYACTGGDTVVRVRAQHPITGRWVPLKSLYGGSAAPHVSIVSKPLCQTVLPVTDFMGGPSRHLAAPTDPPPPLTQRHPLNSFGTHPSVLWWYWFAPDRIAAERTLCECGERTRPRV